MKKLVMIFVCVMFLFSLANVSAGQFTYLKAYYDSLDSSCTMDNQCVVQNVGDCCGYFPMCINSDSVLVPSEVTDICANQKTTDCKPMVISYCRCQKAGSGTKKKCVGFTGNPTSVCGDGNCYLDETNASSKNYCPADCKGAVELKQNESVDYSCQTDSDCLKVNDGCCSCLESGGKVTAVNKNSETNWLKNNVEICKVHGVCNKGPSDDTSCSKDVKCENNKCILTSETKPNCPQLSQPNCPTGTTIASQGKNNNGCDNPGKCVYKLNNGRDSEVKIMPTTASENAKARLGELGFNIELKEVGIGDNSHAVYEMSAEKDGKILGIFNTKYSVVADVDASTGDVTVIKNKPWWIF